MSNLKPHIYGCLYCAWKQVQGMEEIIVKAWDKTRFARPFQNEFQLIMMEANVIKLLFKIMLDIEDHNETYIDTNPTKKIVVVMEKCL